MSAVLEGASQRGAALGSATREAANQQAATQPTATRGVATWGVATWEVATREDATTADATRENATWEDGGPAGARLECATREDAAWEGATWELECAEDDTREDSRLPSRTKRRRTAPRSVKHSSGRRAIGLPSEQRVTAESQVSAGSRRGKNPGGLRCRTASYAAEGGVIAQVAPLLTIEWP
jgi:hypothetical protein